MSLKSAPFPWYGEDPVLTCIPFQIFFMGRTDGIFFQEDKLPLISIPDPDPMPVSVNQQTWSGFSPTTVPDNNRQSGLSPTTVPEMSTGQCMNWTYTAVTVCHQCTLVTLSLGLGCYWQKKELKDQVTLA